MKPNRLEFIDALRGFAAIYVLIYHTVLIPKPGLALPSWISPLILNGNTGVTLFFVISAFTLCYTLDGKQYKEEEVSKFYTRRIFRIVPLYYVWLARMSFLFYGPKWIMENKGMILLCLLFGYNFVPGSQEGIVWASWTLGVEMVFYLMFPFIFRWVTDLKRSYYFLAITLLVSAVHFALIRFFELKDYTIYLSLFHQLPVFATGIVSYFLYKQIDIDIKKGNKYITLGFALFLLFPYVVPKNDFTIYLMMFVFVLILLGLAMSPKRFIVNKVTVFFGLISYSLYLNHPIIVFKLIETYKNIYTRFAGSTLTAFLLSIGLTFCIVTVVSYLTYRIIEKPGMDLGRWIINKRKRELKTEPVSAKSY